MVESHSKRPPDTPFYQQRLKAWQPILTPKWVVITFLCVGIAFIPIGLLLKSASDSVVEQSVQYGGEGQASMTADGGSNCTGVSPGMTCVVKIKAPEDMEAPVFVYYQLDNFYQNHRRYVKSRDDNQLLGNVMTYSALESACEPKVTNSSGSVLHPCGLIANSYFNDVYSLDGPLTLDESNIAWASDVADKFKAVPASVRASHPDVQFIHDTYPSISAEKGVTDEHFIVWMRTAALPSFRKLYGRINTKINKGDMLTFVVNNQFEVNSFDGKKYLVVSTTSWLGGKNDFLGWAYIGVGCCCVLLALIFAIKHKTAGRALGDPQYMSWNP